MANSYTANPLSDVAAERAVLAGICQYGNSAYLDIADILHEECFTSTYNKLCFACIDYCFKVEPSNNIDVASIQSAANNLGLLEIVIEKGYSEHINSLFNFSIEEENVRKFAVKIKKLSMARQLRETMGEAQKKLLSVTGSESISEILAIGENAILGFLNSVDDENEPKLLGEGVQEYIQHIIDNPVNQIGISSGLDRWDRAIGGGLRPATVNVFGARPKVGKSTLSANIGYHISSNLEIPVLNLDTEMTYYDHIHKVLAMMSECYVEDVETGKFVKKPGQEKKIKEAAAQLEERKIPYFHQSIAGMGFEEQIAIIKRWIIKTVGLKSNGHANPCVLIYDYLKLMTGESINSNMTEWQLLGFMLTALTGIAHKYNIPIICYVQLNRDGIDSEESNVAAGSDRIAWFCSNFTIFKPKSDEEIAADGGPQHGNRKLVVVMCRHGAGLEFGNYINCHMRGNIAKIVEGQTKFELQSSNQQSRESESTDSE